MALTQERHHRFAPNGHLPSFPSISSHESAKCDKCHASYEAIKRRHDDLVRQLCLAERVQLSLLPRDLPSVTGVSMAAGILPVDFCAGDFYNSFRLDRDHIGFYIGDVVGHGPAAALLAVFAMHSIRTKRIQGNQYEILPSEAALASLNDALLQADIPDSPFLTMVYGVLDIPGRTCTLSTGGHPAPFLLRPGQPPAEIPCSGSLLGIFPSTFQSFKVNLSLNDRLLLYTDGALTARWGPLGTGIPGLTASFQHHHCQSLQNQLDHALANLQFEDAPADDVALMVIELTS